MPARITIEMLPAAPYRDVMQEALQRGMKHVGGDGVSAEIMVLMGLCEMVSELRQQAAVKVQPEVKPEAKPDEWPYSGQSPLAVGA